MLHIDILITTLTKVCLRCIGLWQFERHVITLLRCDEFIDSFHLWCINEGTLYSDGFCATKIQHITLTYQLLGTCTVKNGLRIDTGTYLKGDTGREVGLDVTSDNGCCRTLCGNDHMDTHGTCQLCNTCYRHFNLLTSCHD